MADTPVPSPGYGNTNEVSLDAYNQWQRGQPWYQALIKSFGQDPNNVHLSDQQKQAVVRAAQAHGAVIDEGTNGQEVDDSGNLRGVGHKLRNTLIVAGIAGAALATAGATGLLSGAAAPAASAGAAGGVESGVTAGLGAAALPGAGTALGGAGGVLGTAGAVGGAFDAAGNFIGDSSIPGATGSFGPSTGLKGILDSASQLAGPLGAIASGRAAGAQAEAGATQAQDRNAISLYNAEQGATNSENNFDISRGNLALGQSNAANNFGINRGTLANANANTDLAQRKFTLDAPGKRASNAVRGDILSNAQDVSFAGLPSSIPVPQINGGLRPSMFSADTRALGKDITSQARSAQAKGDTFAPLPDLPTYQAPEGGLPTYKAGPAAPQLTGLPSGGVTTGLGNASSILSLAPTFANLLKQYQQAS